MCVNCEDINIIIKISSPGELKNMLRQIDLFIKRKSIQVEKENFSYYDFCNEPTRPDNIENVYSCTKCYQNFKLTCETYHGSGGSWSPA